MHAWLTGLADTPPDNASALHALGLGFMAARTLHVALEFDLFTQLSSSDGSISHIVTALGIAERAAQRLLQACHALGLVSLVDNCYYNAPVVETYLVQGKPTYIGSYIQLFDDLCYHRWGSMGQALQQNGPVEGLDHPYRYLDDDADETRTFISAQHHGSTSLGYALARRFDFSPFQCLLDLGGGAGTYTIEILRHYPQLRAIVYDFPHVCRLAETAIQAASMADRAHTESGDYEHDPLPSGPDVVLWSGNLHASSPENCLHILHKLRALLPPHGTVLIHDYMLDATGASPLIPALLALHLTLVSEHGQVYRGCELQALFTQAGFVEVHIAPFLPGHSALVTARVGLDVNREHESH